MISRGRLASLGGLLLLAAIGTAATPPAGDGRLEATLGRPVIGRPVTAPAQPRAGKPFTVSFPVTRSDTGRPLLAGRMVCDPSIAGKVIRHTESFRAGTARLSFVVPADGAGKLLKVKLTIASGGRSATKITAFRIGAKPTLTIEDASVAEGNSGTTTLSFVVTLSPASARVVTVAYATEDGSAVAPADYTAASGTLTFSPGQRAREIPVTVVADTTIEQDETLSLRLGNPTNASIQGDGVAVGTITNDDTTVPITAGSYQGATQSGDYVFFTVLPSRTITGLRFNSLTETCSPPMKRTGEVNFGTNTFAVKADGSFSKEFKGPRHSWKVSGIFTGVSVSGTVVLSDEFDSKGTHYQCSTGVVRWSATHRG